MRIYAKWLSEKYPKELAIFHCLQKRVAAGYCRCVYEKGTNGFLEFIDEVGRIPKTMKQPSISRKKHHIGYQPRNMFWQEMPENSREAGLRNREFHSKKMKMWHKGNRKIVRERYFENVEKIKDGVKRSWAGSNRKKRLAYLKTRRRNERGMFI